MSSLSYSSIKGGLREEVGSRYADDNNSSSTSNESNRKTKDDNYHQETNNMCSVLNVVIDHTMESITPMEAEEWNINQKDGDGDGDGDDKKQQQDDKKEMDNNNNNLLVPVIRIFGPILRDPHRQPLQSACLYIHGAFPYILARPVVAGPDGSIYPHPSTTTHVNWDDRDEVEAIQAEIQATLEETLQSSFLDNQGFSNSANKKEDDYSRRSNKNNKNERRHCPIIRKVTVVEGRGFYTFCPGPSASFLRIGKSSIKKINSSTCDGCVSYWIDSGLFLYIFQIITTRTRRVF